MYAPLFRRPNTFSKFVVLLLALMVPIVALYAYSNAVSVNVVEDQIQSATNRQLTYFAAELDNSLQQLTYFSNWILRDPSVAGYQAAYLYEGSFDRNRLHNRISEVLRLQTISREHNSMITVYFMSIGRAIGTAEHTVFSKDAFGTPLPKGWTYARDPRGRSSFELWVPSVYKGYEMPYKGNIIVHVSFNEQNIRNKLDDFTKAGSNDPFLYKPGYSAIASSSGNGAFIQEVSEHLNRTDLSAATDHSYVMNAHGEELSVTATRLDSLGGWYLIDYVPLRTSLKPIHTSRNMFYISLAGLILIAVLSITFLYRNVQVPIRKLIQGVQRLSMGDYSSRIDYKRGTEFEYLFQRFNHMVNQIQELIEHVYKEQLRSKEATLKQLQSQINPHFIYNCLYFIKNMAELKQNGTIVEMALSLGNYYRYTTRTEQQKVPLHAEIGLVCDYLSIQKYRMPKLEFTIHMDDAMKDVSMPRLILQPLVENAVIHGIEKCQAASYIAVTGALHANYYSIAIEDDGNRMTEEKLAELKRMLSSQDDHDGCGLWNVHQRLVLTFGADSGLLLERSDLGGLKATMRWAREGAQVD